MIVFAIHSQKEWQLASHLFRSTSRKAKGSPSFSLVHVFFHRFMKKQRTTRRRRRHSAHSALTKRDWTNRRDYDGVECALRAHFSFSPVCPLSRRRPSFAYCPVFPFFVRFLSNFSSFTFGFTSNQPLVLNWMCNFQSGGNTYILVSYLNYKVENWIFQCILQLAGRKNTASNINCIELYL